MQRRALARMLCVGLVGCWSLNTNASDFRFSASLGYGGAGLSAFAVVDDASVLVSRSESPATASIGVDTLIADNLGIGFEHSRGVALAPFSSGVSFTGGVVRYYIMGPAPSVSSVAPGKSVLIVRRFSTFVGATIGIASGDVNRTGDQVPQLTGSGMFVGYRVGAEYPLRAGLGLRPEVAFMTTMGGTSALSQFSIQCGVYFFL